MLTARRCGGLIYIRNDEGRIVQTHNAVQLAKSWINLGGGPMFGAIHGFRWDPDRKTLREAQRQLKTNR